MTTEKVSLVVDPTDFLCPITHQVFFRPVMGNDGFFYEQQAIEEVINTTGVSPMNRSKVTCHYDNKFMVATVEKFLLENPDYKKMQYDGKEYLSFSANVRKAIEYIGNNNYAEFSKYTGIKLNHSYQQFNKTTVMRQLTVFCKDISIFDKIISNSIDLNEKDYDGSLPMKYIAENCSKEFILLALSKGVEFKKINNSEDSIISIIASRTAISHNDFADILIDMTNRNYNLNYKNKNKIRDIERIHTRLRQDETLHKTIKNNKNTKPYILFYFDAINGTLANYDCNHIMNFLRIFEMDINEYLKDNNYEDYFRKYLDANLEINDYVILDDTCKYFGAIEFNTKLSNSEKVRVLDRFKEVYLDKLRVYDLWLKTVNEVNRNLYNTSMRNCDVLKEKFGRN